MGRRDGNAIRNLELQWMFGRLFVQEEIGYAPVEVRF
jgi:hypothetical protein